MTSRTRRLAMVAGGVFVAGILLWSFIPVSSEPAQPSGPDVTYATPDTDASISSGVPATPLAPPTPAPTATASRRTYAIGLHELAGLPPDAMPGTTLELWVTWEPPVSKEIQVQLLLKDVLVERVIPPALPEGPTSILLSVPARDIGDLLYGDRYGQLSAVSSG